MLTGLAYVNVPLPDLSAEIFTITGKVNDSDAVQYYFTDGLQIDTANRIRKSFWPAFSKAAFMFTLSEAPMDDTHYVFYRGVRYA